LLVAGTGSGEGLATMATIAAEALERPRPITGLAFRLEDDRWLPWLPPAEDPLYPQFKELQLQSLGRDYAEQKELLDSLHTQRGEDVFVASFSGLRDAAGNVRSYSLWSNGISTLLPKTDAVAFLRDGGDPLMVAWDRVFDLLCRLMTPQGLYPERYRVDGYPTPDELAALSE
ncbi:MAG: hypothetical protein HY000_18125, partial [Planctomycetes bacterium]|nr:hypothetical protein [Planctomycetota bacterium]